MKTRVLGYRFITKQQDMKLKELESISQTGQVQGVSTLNPKPMLPTEHQPGTSRTACSTARKTVLHCTGLPEFFECLKV